MHLRTSAGIERKIEHRLFLLSVWSKGIAGLVDAIGGLLLLFIPQAGLNAVVVFLTAPELAEDQLIASQPFSSASFTSLRQTRNYSPAAISLFTASSKSSL
jgi:uncharacterized membrane protein